MRGIGKDRTKTAIGVDSQRATAQPEVIFASSKPSMTLKFVTAYVWRHPEWCLSSTIACKHTEAVFA